MRILFAADGLRRTYVRPPDADGITAGNAKLREPRVNSVSHGRRAEPRARSQSRDRRFSSSSNESRKSRLRRNYVIVETDGRHANDHGRSR